MDLYTKNALQCSEITTKNYSTSFSSGIRLLNKKYREGIFSIYAYVRFADEIVDTFHNQNKAELLKSFREQTFEANRLGISTNPVLHSFQYVVNQHNIDQGLIEKFLCSMEMDLIKRTFTRLEYDQYIVGSAEVVGLMCMRVFYSDDPEEYYRLEESARSLGKAFQKLNFLRDMKSDWVERGRVYFPGISFDSFSEEEKSIIQREIEQDLAAAYVGLKMLKRDVRLGVYIAYKYYQSLFRKIAKSPSRVIINRRIRISNFRKFVLLISSIIRHKFDWI